MTFESPIGMYELGLVKMLLCEFGQDVYWLVLRAMRVLHNPPKRWSFGQEHGKEQNKPTTKARLVRSAI